MPAGLPKVPFLGRTATYGAITDAPIRTADSSETAPQIEPIGAWLGHFAAKLRTIEEDARTYFDIEQLSAVSKDRATELLVRSVMADPYAGTVFMTPIYEGEVQLEWWAQEGDGELVVEVLANNEIHFVFRNGGVYRSWQTDSIDEAHRRLMEFFRKGE